MPDEGAEAELVERLAAIVRGASSLMQVLTTIRALNLPDWLMMSGAVYQRVLNALTRRSRTRTASARLSEYPASPRCRRAIPPRSLRARRHAAHPSV